MSNPNWYYAHLRWAVMVEGKEGLRHWVESVYMFRSESHDMAFRQALEIGYRNERRWKDGRRLVVQRLAAVVTLDCLGADPRQLQVDLGQRKPEANLPFEHVFHPEEVEPAPFF
jgi:hypothetical protein